MTSQTASKRKAARIARELGDPRQVARDLRRAREAARVFSADHPRLIEEHPQQWVLAAS